MIKPAIAAGGVRPSRPGRVRIHLMAFLRRGYVPRDYDGPPILLLTELSGRTAMLPVKTIQCFEEHDLPRCLRPFTTIFTYCGQHVVAETFDEVQSAFARKMDDASSSTKAAPFSPTSPAASSAAEAPKGGA